MFKKSESWAFGARGGGWLSGLVTVYPASFLEILYEADWKPMAARKYIRLALM